MVKAKSSGTCTYEPVTGTSPSTIGWELNQLLVRFPPYNTTPQVFSNLHPKNGLKVAWIADAAYGEPGAQVYTDTCVNADYTHTDHIYVTPPPGWLYNGPQPLTFGNNPAVIVTVDDC